MNFTVISEFVKVNLSYLLNDTRPNAVELPHAIRECRLCTFPLPQGSVGGSGNQTED